MEFTELWNAYLMPEQPIIRQTSIHYTTISPSYILLINVGSVGAELEPIPSTYGESWIHPGQVANQDWHTERQIIIHLILSLQLPQTFLLWGDIVLLTTEPLRHPCSDQMATSEARKRSQHGGANNCTSSHGRHSLAPKDKSIPSDMWQQ